MGILFGFVYLAGLTREKISGKKHKTDIPKVSENIAEKQPETINKDQNKNSKKKWIWAGIILIILVVIVALVSNSPSEDEQDISLVKTDKSGEFSEQSGNLYRNTKYNFRIKFPEGWEIKDGDGPNVLKKAVSGGSTIGIIVKDFKNTPEFLDLKNKFVKETGMPLTDDIAEEVVSELNANDFSDNDFKDMMTGVLEGIESSPRESKLIESKIGNIGGEKAFYTKTETAVKVLHIGEADSVGLTYTTLHGGIFYHIFAGFPKEDADLMEKEILLSIASIVFENF
jgi:hypothetical protein